MMYLSELQDDLHPLLYEALDNQGLQTLRPSQEKAIQAGLLQSESLLICTPTASGKTLVAEIAALQSILNNIGKAIYVVPLKALASEKFKSFRKRYGHLIRIGISTGESDSAQEYLNKYDLILLTSEKLDSIIRHHARWLEHVKVVIVDEIHLLNDASRGPTLEILLVLLRSLLYNMQLIGLSATIGNPQQLSEWLGTRLIEDNWRPTRLYQGVYHDGHIEFIK